MTYSNRLILLLAVVAVCLSGCSAREAEKSNVSGKKNLLSQTTLLLTIPDDEKPQSAAPSSGMGMHAPLQASFEPLFSKNGAGVAYGAEKDNKVYVVHNGRAGKQYDAVTAIAISPDGRRVAYGALADGKWRMVMDGKEGAAYSTVKSPLFSQDSSHLAYQAMSGEKWYLVVDTMPNAGTATRILDHQFSGDSKKVAFIDNSDDKNRGRLVVSDLAFAQQTIIGTGISKIIMNQDVSRIAAISVRENKQQMLECAFDRPDSVKKGPQYDGIYSPVFAPDGVSLAYVAERGGQRFMVLNSREESLPEGALVEPLVVRPDNKVIGNIMASNTGAFMNQSFLGGGLKGKEYDEAVNLVYSRSGGFHAYAARKGESWFVVVNGKEGPAFDRVVTPLFSPDEKFLVYRARQSGKRFVVVADTVGKTVKMHPTYEQVFDVQFTADGKSVAYGVKDGNKLIWKVEKL